MNAKNLTATAFAGALALALLAGCGESKQEPAKPAAASVPAAEVYDVVAKKAAGFTVGNMMAAKVVYVFFDTQCPHCAAFWKEVKPVLGQIRMVWIPVRLLADISAQQGAMILSAGDAAAEMDKNERSRDAGGKGLEPRSDIPKELTDKVRANTDLMVSIGASAVPYLVYKNPVNGQSAAYEGGMDAEGLKKLLGL